METPDPPSALPTYHGRLRRHSQFAVVHSNSYGAENHTPITLYVAQPCESRAMSGAKARHQTHLHAKCNVEVLLRMPADKAGNRRGVRASSKEATRTMTDTFPKHRDVETSHGWTPRPEQNSTAGILLGRRRTCDITRGRSQPEGREEVKGGRPRAAAMAQVCNGTCLRHSVHCVLECLVDV